MNSAHHEEVGVSADGRQGISDCDIVDVQSMARQPERLSGA
jgi:hypothetical protein